MDWKKKRKRYALAAGAVLAFAAVYERFSHQVYSGFMIFAFLFPLLGGLLPCMLLPRLPKRFWPPVHSACLYDSGIAALTTGSLFRGILDIYGTTSRLGKLYWIAGAALIFAGIAACAAEKCAKTLKRM